MEEKTIWGVVLAVMIFGSIGTIAWVIRQVKKTARNVVIREKSEEETLGI